MLVLYVKFKLENEQVKVVVNVGQLHVASTHNEKKQEPTHN